MPSLKIYDLLKKRVLVTRDLARSLQPQLAAALVEGRGEVELDFSEVAGLTPSFLDETLAVLEECAQETPSGEFRVIVKNPPTELSSKFAAVGRGHELSVRMSDGGTWVISR